jgi:hypothetical protein
LCEGKKGDGSGKRTSIDPVFINKLMSTLKPAWIRQEGSNIVRSQPCGGRSEVIKRMPGELKLCLSRGGDTTLMVWADCDDDCGDGDALKREFWKEAVRAGITKEQFESVVFIFPKDRLENWIEYLLTGATNEAIEGRRTRQEKSGSEARVAAERLADMCKEAKPVKDMPPSLQWSCKNWRALEKRMKDS